MRPFPTFIYEPSIFNFHTACVEQSVYEKFSFKKKKVYLLSYVIEIICTFVLRNINENKYHYERNS